jgi:hypothetical protein
MVGIRIAAARDFAARNSLHRYYPVAVALPGAQRTSHFRIGCGVAHNDRCDFFVGIDHRPYLALTAV